MKNKSVYKELVDLLILERQEIPYKEWEETQKRIQEILSQMRNSADEIDKIFVEIMEIREASNGKDS